MAYFPNGTSFEFYAKEQCLRCVHYEDCPIILLHLLWNYDQIKDETKRTALNTLWPQDADGVHNGDCKMFVPEQTVPDYRETMEEIISLVERQLDAMEE